jgi:ubiquinone/menaquinone biosynthesis C-methylase UbiE
MYSLYYTKHYINKLKTRIILNVFKNKYKRLLAHYKPFFDNKCGLEIGGPSNLFLTDILPVYNWSNKIDGCNFSNNTLWEGQIRSNKYEYFPDKVGYQYIMEGSNLSEIEDEKYDFLLSCHNLEHIANPLMAVKEWMRVLKPGGFMLLVLPEKKFTFDHRREYTTFEHILLDFETGVKEDDLTHLPEILKLHDLRRDPGAGRDHGIFKLRGENNFKNRALHHHVFSQQLLKRIFEYFNIKTISQDFIPPHHLMILGQKEINNK